MPKSLSQQSVKFQVCGQTPSPLGDVERSNLGGLGIACLVPKDASDEKALDRYTQAKNVGREYVVKAFLFCLFSEAVAA